MIPCSSLQHPFSCTSTTSRLCFPDMSPTPYMQMISPCGVHLNTPHPLLTESRKLWTRYSSRQMTGVWTEVKTQASVFSLSTSKKKSYHKAWRQQLPQVETPTFLGVKLDTRLPWKPHIKDMETKSIKKLAVLKKLSGSHWGANSKILKTVYIGAVRPSLEYGVSAWATAANTHTNKLDKVQNMTRTILGALKTTPKAEMEKTAGGEPLESRRQANTSHLCRKDEEDARPTPEPKAQRPHEKQIEKEKSEPTCKRKAERTCRNPYNWCTPLRKIEPKQLATRNPKSWDQDNHPWHHFEGTPEWSSFGALALEEIDKHFPTTSWTHIYTDGSAENATRNGRCGAYIKRPGKPPFSVSAPGGILCSNYRAEVLALLKATETIISWEEKP